MTNMPKNPGIKNVFAQTFIVLSILIFASTQLQTAKAQKSISDDNPTLGWSSLAGYGAGVTEAEVLKNSGFIATHLARFGWEYIIVDYCWYFPNAGSLKNPEQDKNLLPELSMDSFGRLLPDLERFPSSKGNKGFKPLAEKLHKQGLKFGIHLMRGIPRQAVRENTRIKDTKYTASNIADTNSRCTWLNHMFGVDAEKPGAQEYYNSVFEQFAKWGIDYVLLDDITLPLREKEIALIHKAAKNSGRAIRLSISAGEIPPSKSDKLKPFSTERRITSNYCSNWENVLHLFTALESYRNIAGENYILDAGLIPTEIFGMDAPEGANSSQLLNKNELISILTLWSIARSPLIISGDLIRLSSFQLKQFQNSAVLSVVRNSRNSRQFFSKENQVAWIAEVTGKEGKYLAVFNLSDTKSYIPVELYDAGFEGECQVTDLWTGDFLGQFEKRLRTEVPAHGARLFYINAIKE